MKTIVLGVGNPILQDDGVGIHVVNELKKQINDRNITIDEAATGGMNLLDLILGYDKAILVDAVKTAGKKEGEVLRLNPLKMNSVHSCNPHDVSLIEAIKMAEALGEKNIPKDIVIVGITLKNTPTVFGDKLSKNIESSIPKAVEIVLSEIKKPIKLT